MPILLSFSLHCLPQAYHTANNFTAWNIFTSGKRRTAFIGGPALYGPNKNFFPHILHCVDSSHCFVLCKISNLTCKRLNLDCTKYILPSDVHRSTHISVQTIFRGTNTKTSLSTANAALLLHPPTTPPHISLLFKISSADCPCGTALQLLT